MKTAESKVREALDRFGKDIKLDQDFEELECLVKIKTTEDSLDRQVLDSNEEQHILEEEFTK